MSAVVPPLLLVKRLFVESETFADQGEPVAAGLALSLLQDATELYVWTVIKERNLSVKDQAGFVSNMETLQKAGLPMPYSARLLELNRARVNFKHYGNLPAPDESKKYRTYVGEALRQAMLDHFSIVFDDVSLVDLLANVEIRDLLKNADAQVAKGNFSEAAIELAKAKSLTFGLTGKYLPRVSSRLRNADRIFNAIAGAEGSQPFEYLTEYLEALRDATLVGMLRLPLEDYAFLQTDLPNAAQSITGAWHFGLTKKAYSAAECKRASESIVKLCIRLQALP